MTLVKSPTMEFSLNLLFILITFISSVFGAESAPVVNKQNENLMQIVRLCWSLREHIPFLDREFTFDLNTFKENADFDPTLFQEYRDFMLPLPNLGPLTLSANQIKSASGSHIINAVYNDSKLFSKALTSSKRYYLVAESGVTIAHLAVLDDNSYALEAVLNSAPFVMDIAIKRTRTTLLHLAVTQKAYNCARLLLKKGASPFASDFAGSKPIDLVLAKGDSKMLSNFLAFSDLISHPAIQKASGVALQSGLVEWAVKFILSGAEANIIDPSRDASILHLMLKLRKFGFFKELRPLYPPNPSVPAFVIKEKLNEALGFFTASELAEKYNGASLLTIAFEKGNAGGFIELVRRVPAFKSMTASTTELQLLAFAAARSGSKKFLDILFKSFRKELKPWTVIGPTSVLGHVLDLNYFDLADWMIEAYGANLSVCRFEGLPIHERALLTHNHRLYAYLVSRGLNPNVRLAIGDSALHFAIKTGDYELTRMILSYQPDLNEVDSFGMNAAMLASVCPIPEIRALFFN